MTLEFDVKSIRSYANMLGQFEQPTYMEVARDVPTSFLQRYGSGFETGVIPTSLLGMIVPTHLDIYESAMGTFRRMSDVLDNSKRELEDAADRYLETDRENRHQLIWGTGVGQSGRRWLTRHELERFDESIGAVTRPPADRTTPGPRDFDIDPDPYRHLAKADSPFPDNPADVAGAVGKVVDRISLAHWAGAALEQLVGWNPISLVSDGLMGDWQGYARCIDMWKRLGASMLDLSNRVWKGNRTLDEVWHGNAADMCFEYHHRLAFAIRALHKPLSTLTEGYRSLAVNIAVGAKTIEDLLKAIIDTLTLALLAMTFPTAAAVAAVKKVFELAGQVGHVIMWLRALILKTEGSIREAGVAIAAFQKSFPPAHDYHNYVLGR